MASREVVVPLAVTRMPSVEKRLVNRDLNTGPSPVHTTSTVAASGPISVHSVSNSKPLPFGVSLLIDRYRTVRLFTGDTR